MTKIFPNKILCCLSACFLITLKMNLVKAVECGITQFARPLISDGNKTQRGEWPFLTALFKVTGAEFFCGGNLISDKHVLTAAHCIQQKGNILKLIPADMFVLLGGYNLTLRNETTVLKRNVNDIYVHPDWDVYSEKYDADLAILLLNETVQFTNYIRPVCMPPDNALTDGSKGSVVGWGKNENETQNLEFIKRANVAVLRASYCYTTDSIVAAISSGRTFCGQGEDGTPGEGDSGGGFYVLFGTAWVQYGVVSSSRKSAGHYIVADVVSVYANVMEFKSWIVERVVESGSAVSEAKTTVIEVNLKCDYMFTETYSYICLISDLDLRGANFAVASFTGVHHFPYTDQDVREIIFFNGTMFSLPFEIGKVYKNLTLLKISEDLRIESIRRSHLKNLDNLKVLLIYKNEIVALDKYALWDLPNLEQFFLHENHLKEITAKTFEKNLKLKIISIYSNQLEVLPSNLLQHNSYLEKVTLCGNFIKVIDQRVFETNTQLREVWLCSNKLKILPKNLFHNNSLLEVVTLHENSLEIIDEEIFMKNEKLQRVSLFSNQLEVLPSNIFQNNLLLEILSLQNNFLSVVNESIFSASTKLKYVDLSSNKLEVLPWNLFQNNILLETIHMQENSLKIIDERIFDKNAILRVVDLSSNHVEVLHWQLFQNNSFVKILKLREMSLKVIDERIFEKNTELREIYLSSNQLQVIPSNLFKNNLLLEMVFLFNNSLKIINEGTFDKNVNLKYLHLHANQLEMVPSNLLENNILLRIVSFRGNSLKSIDERIFEKNEQLGGVDLASNQLEVVPKNIFKNNLLLQSIDLGGNLFKTIDIDFTAFTHINRISFLYSDCVSAWYDVINPNTYRYQYTNLTEFLDLVKTNCSTHNSSQ